MFALTELAPWLPTDQYKILSDYIDAGNQSLGINYDNYKGPVNSNIEQLTGYSPDDVSVGAEFESAKSLLIPHFANLLKYYSKVSTGRVGEEVTKGYEFSIRELKLMSRPPSAEDNTDKSGLVTSGLIDNLGGF